MTKQINFSDIIAAMEAAESDSQVFDSAVSILKDARRALDAHTVEVRNAQLFREAAELAFAKGYISDATLRVVQQSLPGYDSGYDSTAKLNAAVNKLTAARSDD